jgi:hypothetical protein
MKATEAADVTVEPSSRYGLIPADRLGIDIRLTKFILPDYVS